MKRMGRAKNVKLVRGNSVQEGLEKDFKRETFILKVEISEKLRDYAYTERLSIKDAVNNLLECALATEEKIMEKKGEKLLSRHGKG